MGVELNKTFSAGTALILLDNVEVGQLQSIVVRENYNVLPVNNLGSSIPVAWVPGIFQGTVTAKRALLELDKVFQALAPGTDAETLVQLGDRISSAIAGVIQTALSLNDVISQIANFFSGKTVGQPFSEVITFTIKILDIDNNEQMKLEQCVLTGRSFALDVGGIVIMQDLDILFQKRAI